MMPRIDALAVIDAARAGGYGKLFHSATTSSPSFVDAEVANIADMDAVSSSFFSVVSSRAEYWCARELLQRLASAVLIRSFRTWPDLCEVIRFR